MTEWLLAAKSIGLKAKYVEKHFARLSMIPLPALIWRDDGKHYILSRVTKDHHAILFMILNSISHKLLARDEFEKLYQGKVILVTSRATVVGELAKFNFPGLSPLL
ncbi:cysteine peptidase family C39 domain-containing protein [Escherichia coli]